MKRDEFPASKESPKQCVNASNDDSNLDKTPEISKKPNEQPLRRVVAVKISEVKNSFVVRKKMFLEKQK